MFNKATSAERDAIAERVNRDRQRNLTCSSCGAVRACPTGSEVIVYDRIRDDGTEYVYGLCSTCHSANKRGKLNRHAVAIVLDLDIGDPVLAGITAERFSELPHARPERPNNEPWGHLDRAELAAEVESARVALKRREGGPCWSCGVGITPPGTTWRTIRLRNEQERRPQCGSCTDRYSSASGLVRSSEGQQLAVHVDKRAIVAVALAGLATPTRKPIIPMLGRECAVVFFHETDRRKPNRYPWEHLDIAAVRNRCDELMQRGQLHRPARWTPDMPSSPIDW